VHAADDCPELVADHQTTVTFLEELSHCVQSTLGQSLPSCCSCVAFALIQEGRGGAAAH
jgi:hypothetical protein